MANLQKPLCKNFFSKKSCFFTLSPLAKWLSAFPTLLNTRYDKKSDDLERNIVRNSCKIWNTEEE